MKEIIIVPSRRDQSMEERKKAIGQAGTHLFNHVCLLCPEVQSSALTYSDGIEEYFPDQNLRSNELILVV